MKIQLSDHFTYRKLFRFTLPSIVMMIFTSIYGVVDGFFVSNFVGKTPFAAVNFTWPFLMVLGAFGFMLPVISAPKKRRDWEMLSERRDAAESVIKLYILGTKKALGYGPDRLERAVRATEENFRHFGDYAKDGDYYGYEVLAKRLEQLFHTQIAVKEEKTDEPIFGKSLT